MVYEDGSRTLTAAANSNPGNRSSRLPALFLALSSRYLRFMFCVLTRRLPTCASFSCNRRVSSSCRRNCTTVYSPVILLLAWPAIWLASMLPPPTPCRQVMLARRSVCRPRPAKSHPSTAAVDFSALRTPESHIGRVPSCLPLGAKEHTEKGGRKLDFPACGVPRHTAFEAAKANKNSPSMRVGPIRRRSGCCARVRAPLKAAIHLTQGARFGQDRGRMQKDLSAAAATI